MATRTIVTSQPDVACDVCARRLLRGEQADVFLAAGRRRVVCELCAPRAVHEGWLRETDSQAVGLPALSPRRGRSLFGRLRQVGRPAGAPEELPGAGDPFPGRPALDGEPQPYDFLDDGYKPTAAPVPAAPRSGSGHAPAQIVANIGPQGPEGAATLDAEGASAAAAAHAPAAAIESAVAVFNASEHARRTAGVARSLGAPEVSVRTAEHAGSVVEIVIAWELCWYRYRVDLDEQPVEVQLLAEGTELRELAREDRLANALADDSGALVLSGA